MDKEERRVLRRKRYTISTHFTLTEDLLRELLSRTLITHQGSEQVKVSLMQDKVQHMSSVSLFQSSGKVMFCPVLHQVENTNLARVERWMEVLPQITGKNTYAQLCDFLEEHTALLGDDLRLELKVEKCQRNYRIEDWIHKEADALVQRDFGNSRRLSEFDKRDIRNLLEVRMQMMKELWIKQRKRVQNTLDGELKVRDNYREKNSELDRMINSFLRVNKQHLRSNIQFEKDVEIRREMNGVSKALPPVDDRDLANKLYQSVRELIDVSNQCIIELEELREERRKSAEVIGMTDKSLPLYHEIQRILDHQNKEISELSENVKSKAGAIEKLEGNIKKITNKAREEEDSSKREIKRMKCHLHVSHEKVKELEEFIERLEHELAETQDEMNRVRNKSEMLEKTRRLGFKTDVKKQPKRK